MENQYNPDYAVHPSVFLREWLLAKSIKIINTGDRNDIDINSVVNGEVKITLDVAKILENNGIGTRHYWMRLQHRYDDFISQNNSINDVIDGVDSGNVVDPSIVLHDMIHARKSFDLEELFNDKTIPIIDVMNGIVPINTYIAKRLECYGIGTEKYWLFVQEKYLKHLKYNAKKLINTIKRCPKCFESNSEVFMNSSGDYECIRCIANPIDKELLRVIDLGNSVMCPYCYQVLGNLRMDHKNIVTCSCGRKSKWLWSGVLYE